MEENEPRLTKLDAAISCFSLILGCALFSAAVFTLCSMILFVLPMFAFSVEPPLSSHSRTTQMDASHEKAPAALQAASGQQQNKQAAYMLPTAEPSSLLYRDLEERRGRFERVARRRASAHELILLTSDRDQLPMTLNLVNQLAELGLSHHLLLGRDQRTCAPLRRRGRIACAYSSYLLNTTQNGTNRPSDVNAIERHWLQRHHYVGRAIAAGLNVLLLDSDVVVSRSPYPYLKSPRYFGGFHAVVLSDSTGAASPLHINGGVWYLQNCSKYGPLRQLFRRFDAHVKRTLASSPRNGSTFDQLILNVQGATLLPPTNPLALLLSRNQGMGKSAADALVDLAPSLLWTWSCCHPAPKELPQPGGSYPARFGFRWLTLAPPQLAQLDPAEAAELRMAAATNQVGEVASTRTSTTQAGQKLLFPTDVPGPQERLAKAPPWLFSAESDLAPPPWGILGGGVRVDSRGWGAAPPPWVLTHFVCSAWPGAAGREQAMRAWGHWRARAISRDLPEYARTWRAARSLMVGLAAPVAHIPDLAGKFDDVMVGAYEWARLVIAMAAGTGRTPVLPAMTCDEQMLRSRSFWQVRRNASLSTCLMRWPNGCGDVMTLPEEAREAAGSSVKTIRPGDVSELIALLRPDAAAHNVTQAARLQRRRADGARRLPMSTDVEAISSPRPMLLLIDLSLVKAPIKNSGHVARWATQIKASLHGQPMAHLTSWAGRGTCPLAHDKKTPPRCQSVC